MFYAKRKMITDRLCRTETLDGAECLVFPMVMMTEGVHAGSNGPTLYLNEFLGKHPEAWNMKPVVVRHPEENGNCISACSKEVIEKQSIGIILNACFEDGRLKAEAWINKEKANRISPGLLETLRSGRMMEVSIGHYAEEEDVDGEWNGETYIRKAITIKPDHLALLPAEIGACSILDGAGIPRINKDCSIEDTSLYAQISKKLRDTGLTDYVVEAVHDNSFVYYAYDAETYFKRPYSVRNNKVEIGTPEKVRRSVEYITVNVERTETMEELMKLLTERGLSNEGIEALKALSEPDASILNTFMQEPDPPGTPEPADVPENLTVNEYLQRVPECYREVLEDGVRLLTTKRDELVTTIVANKKSMFSKEDLRTRSVSELEKLAALACVTEPDYTVAGAVTANHGVTITEEPLPEVSLLAKGE